MQRKPASREEEKSDWPVFRSHINEAGCYTTLLQGFASYNKEGQSFIEAGLSLLEVFTLIQPTMEEIEFKKHIYKKYSSHFDPFLRLHQLAESSLSNYNGFTKNHYDAALVLIFPRAYKSFDAIRRLCEVALCEDAAVILRCLLNLLVVTRWISLRSDARAEKYIRWYWVAMYREAEESKGIVPAAHLAEIQTNYNAVKSLFEYHDTKGDIRMPKFWYAPEANTIFDMFKEVGLEKQYNEGYRPLSGVEHSDAMAFYAMVGEAERSVNRRKLAIQSDLFIPACLRNAFQYFGDIFTICNATIALADGNQLAEVIAQGKTFYAGDMPAKGIPTE